MRLLDIFESLDAPTPTVEDLATKYNVSVNKVKTQLSKGIKVEKEHTSDTKQATEIALDHLGEDLHYYTKLAKARLQEADQMELPGIPTPQQAMSQSNLKQYGSPSWRATTPTGVDGQGEHQGFKARITSLYKLSPRDNFIVNGKAEITTPDGQKMLQPWSLVVQRKTGAVLAKNVNKLNDFALDAVFNHVTTAGLMRKQYANPLAGDIQDDVMEADQHQDSNTEPEKQRTQNPNLFYQGKNPKIKQLIQTAKAHYPEAKNDVEAVFALIKDQDDLNKQQQNQLNAGQKLIKNLQAELNRVEVENEDQHQALIQLAKDYSEQEKRFRDFTARTANMPAQAQAQGAQQIQQQNDAMMQKAVPQVNEQGSTGIRKHYFRVDSFNQDVARQLGLKQDRGGNWVLYQTPQSGSRFDRVFSDAVRSFGHPVHSETLKESSKFKKKDTLINAISDFLPIAVKFLKLKSLPKIHLVKDLHDTHVPTFGRFQNESEEISVVINHRQPVDILRTLAHEMAHHAQGERGELDADSWHTGSSAENQAHEQAGIIMREFDKKFPHYLKLDAVDLPESWSKEYKKSINCSNPKGFSQKAHCAGRKARQAGKKTKSSSVSESVDNVEIIHEPSGRGHYIEARIDGREVGRVWFNPTKGGYKASMAWVSKDLRRQGIARKMYQYARDTLGLDIVPSDVQSDDARAFWATNPIEEGKHCNVKNAVPELKAALDKRKKQLNKLSDKQVYDKIDKIMTRIANTYDITGQQLHDLWTKKYGEIPDTYILDEGKIANAALVASLAGVLAQQPAQAETSPVAQAIGIARKINAMKGYGAEGAKAEAQQELMNLLRAMGGQGDNYSKIYPLIKDMANTPGELPTNPEQLPPLTDTPVNENFADGKKPGRKGLAKRVGVDCGQSISKLRSIAKSSSGERQRMAHWCANMKSGRSK